MPTMKSVQTGAPGTIKVARDPAPGCRAQGPAGAGTRLRHLRHRRGLRADGRHAAGPEGETASIPLGHEAGEVVEIGAEVTGLKTGNRVVVNPQAAPSGIIGCGGTLGGMSEYLLIQNAAAGKSVAVFPDDLPFE